ncbi:MAG: hypothetical protein ACTSYI_15600, partial [Promethearchaeota archaeon]
MVSYDYKQILSILKSFAFALGWTLWIYVWFFYEPFTDFIFNSPISRDFIGNSAWTFHYCLGTFLLYAILYPPQNSHNSKSSLKYLLKIIFLQFVNEICLVLVYLSRLKLPLAILCLLLNFILVYSSKYKQLQLWVKFTSTIVVSATDRSFIRENHIKLFLFNTVGTTFLYLAGYTMAFYSIDMVYFIFFSEIILSVGYWQYISEHRKWMDRFVDFLALIILTILNLFLNYGLWLYVKINIIDMGLIFWFLFGSIFLLQLYGYHQFAKRTFLADYFIHHQRNPVKRQPAKSTKSTISTHLAESQDLMKSKKSAKTGSEEVRCPKCHSVIEQLEHSEIIENLSIFCPYCGE